MKYLGIDFGTKRLGIATSDEAGEFAFPKGIIHFDNEGMEKLVMLIKEEEIMTVVIGESVASNGEVNNVDEAAKKFAKKLTEKTGVEIVFEREGFSSVEAHRYQTSAGSRDDSAAAVILQRFLDKKKKVV